MLLVEWVDACLKKLQNIVLWNTLVLVLDANGLQCGCAVLVSPQSDTSSAMAMERKQAHVASAWKKKSFGKTNYAKLVFEVERLFPWLVIFPLLVL